MTVKMDSGNYKCNICDKVFERYKDARNHEKLCGIQSLDKWVENVSWINEIEEPDDDEVLTRQLKLSENFIGNCPNCGNVITESTKIKGLNQREAFECSRCEKVVIDE